MGWTSETEREGPTGSRGLRPAHERLRRPSESGVVEPPNYRPAFARFDAFCWICSFYRASWCLRFGCPVFSEYTCDDWKRDAERYPPQVH